MDGSLMVLPGGMPMVAPVPGVADSWAQAGPPAAASAPQAAPLPPPRTQQEADDRYDAKLFTGGLDHVKDVLDPSNAETLQGLLAGEDNPSEATARMVNMSYASRHTKMDPDQMANNWDAGLRDEFASAVAERPMSGVSDTQLYGLIGKSITQRQGEIQMMGHVQSELLRDAIEGGTSYFPTYQLMLPQMQKDLSYSENHADQYLFAAKGAWAQIEPMAARIAPVAKMVAADIAARAGSPYTQGTFGDRQPLIDALSALNPRERDLALMAATDMAGKSIQAAQQEGQTPKPGTGQMLMRGARDLGVGAYRTIMRMAPPEEANRAGTALLPTRATAENAEQMEISRSLDNAYEEANAPSGGKLAQAWYGFAQNLPPLAATILNPEAGIPLVLGQMSDQTMGNLEKRGMSEDSAFAGGLIAAAPTAAIMKLQGNILEGDTLPFLSKMLDAHAGSLGQVAGKSFGQFGANMAVLNVGQAMMDAAEPGAQAIMHAFDKDNPAINPMAELRRIGGYRLDSFINLLPLAVVGSGVGQFREGAPLRSYLSRAENLRALGLSESQAEEIAKASDAATAGKLLMSYMVKPEGTTESRASAIKAVNMRMGKVADSVLKAGGTTIQAPDDPHDVGKHLETAAELLADARTHEEATQGEMFHVGEDHSQQAGMGQAEKALSDNLMTVKPAEAPGIAQRVAESLQEGQKAAFAMPLPDGVRSWLGGAQKAASEAVKEVRADPELTPFKGVLNGLIGRMQRNTLEVRRMVETIKRLVPKPADREGITNWVQANGDQALLKQRLDATSNESLRRGYEAALNLNTEHQKAARFIQQFYADKFTELNKAGLIDQARDNYVNQVWKRDYVGGGDAAQFAGKLQKVFKFGKEATFGSYFEGEQAGFSPVTKDISKLAGVYLSEANKVVATREFLRQLTSMEGPDSTPELRRPLAAPFGGGTISQSAEEGPSFIRPMQRSEATADYKVIDNPAMRGWKWLGEDANNQPVMMEGQLGVHPEIRRFINALVGRDRLRDWYNEPGSAGMNIVKGGLKMIDQGTSAAKGLMFSLSGYHQVQESIRALGYRVNPFANLPDLEAKSPLVTRSTDAGLMLAADNAGMRDFMEGYGSHSIFENVPVAGPLAAKYSSWLFEDYLPRLKQKTWEAAVERNTDRYEGELASGKMTQADVDYLTASQVNAAYGHLNYADLGRSPTVRHISRLMFLAPDFLESTARTVGQAGKAMVGNKAGLEQFQALAFLGLTQWLTSRVLNKTLDGDWHMDDPFGVTVGDKRYSVRTIPGDIVEAITAPRQFAFGRFSPLVNDAWEVGSGKNYRGERVGITDSLRDVATNTLPMSLRPVAGGLMRITGNLKGAKNLQGPANTSAWDQFITSNGLRISRSSEINQAFHLGQQYAKAQGVKDDGGVYPVSEWQGMRYALEDGDLDRAQQELNLVKSENPKMATPARIEHAFKESLFRPFTGQTKKMDAAFASSLEGKDKETLEKAVAQRQKVWSDFLQLGLGKEPTTQAGAQK